MVKEDMRSIFSADELEETLLTEVDNMKAAKVKMEEVREENETLKLTLSQMMKNYHSLKMQLNGAVRDDRSRKTANSASSDDESELVCLSLGRFSGESRRSEKKTKNSNLENYGLELGLDCKSHDSGDCIEVTDDLKLGNSFQGKEDGNNDVVRSPEKCPKTSRSGDDEVLQYNPSKKPRVSVKAVCNTQTMHDGCQWRKYGQKVAKGNPCPRAYYRCMVSSSCPVRKQVQRCVDDVRILTTTYEGTHNHPLPPSATAMASTTSAAAAMLNCGSTASPPVSTTRFGFNFPSPNHNLITIASSQSHPTVILDLTAPNHNLNKFTHSSPTSLNFSSNPQNTVWGNRFPTINNANFAAQPSIPKQTASDLKIAEATQAITRDPTFQSALAAAITSFVGADDGRGRNFSLNFAQPSTSNGSVGCGPSFLNKFPPTANSQQMNLTRFAPVTLPASKSPAVSLADHEGEERKLL